MSCQKKDRWSIQRQLTEEDKRKTFQHASRSGAQTSKKKRSRLSKTAGRCRASRHNTTQVQTMERKKNSCRLKGDAEEDEEKNEDLADVHRHMQNNVGRRSMAEDQVSGTA